MALLDRERNVIVVRVVYDGPPEAGKTTSLRALAGSLGQDLYSPAEHNGRTLYFDWMDYTGGRFEGYQIRCQIVSVPGQRELAVRRHRLLREADAIVHVADSTRARLELTLDGLRELPRLLVGVPPPALGVILQANKRDLPDAVPMPELRARLRDAGLGLGVVESVAADGTGIRETFVFAVRLALDRVREQLRTHTLPTGRPDVEDGPALLAHMHAAEGASPPRLAAPLATPIIRQVIVENDDPDQLTELAPWRSATQEVTSHAHDAPAPPDPAVPSGAIWPPVEGRLLLHEAAATDLTPRRLPNGSWAAGLGNGWRAYSAEGAVYADLDVGRERLIAWARLHAACSALLSPHRCIVLCATGHGGWRLWQIVRAERSLRDFLDDIHRSSTAEAAVRLIDAATLLGEMSQRVLAAPCHLLCSLDTVGRGERGPVYVGLVPMERVPTAPSLDAATNRIRAELDAILGNALCDRRAEVLALIARDLATGPWSG